MKVLNNLKRRLEEMGIKSMVPTEDLLRKKLGGMTHHRFNKILANSNARELTIAEARALTKWLANMTNQPETAINLWESEAEEQVTNTAQ